MSDTDLYSRPTLTYLILIACTAIFFVEIAYGMSVGSFGSNAFNNAVGSLFGEYGFSVSNVLEGKVWTLMTSVFLHSGTEHLILNMLALFFFGRVVEMKMGRKKLLIVFLLSAIAGNLAFMALSLATGALAVTVIGASGAIFGLMGAAMLASPLEMVFYPYLIPVPLVMVAVLYTIFNIGSFIFVAIGLQESNVSFIAHIGGLVAGMAVGFKEGASKRALGMTLFILALLILIPFAWTAIQFLESFNYTSILSGLIG